MAVTHRLALLAAIVALPGCQLTIPNGLLDGLSRGTPTAVKGDAPGSKPGDVQPTKGPGTDPVGDKPARPPVAPPIGRGEPGGFTNELPIAPPMGRPGGPPPSCDETFKRLDADRDGGVDFGELSRWEALQQPMGQGCAAPMPGPGPEPMPMPMPMPMPVDRALQQLDPNQAPGVSEPGMPGPNGEPGMMPGMPGPNGMPGMEPGMPGPNGMPPPGCGPEPQPAGPHPDPMDLFAKFDFNADKRLDPKEFCGFSEAWFAPPGVIGGEPGFPPPPPGPDCKDAWRQADANGDGMVGIDEYMRADFHGGMANMPAGMGAPAVMPSEDEMRQRFKMRDRDGNAQLDPGEWCSEDPNMPTEPPMEPPIASPIGDCGDVIRKIDRNGDGQADWGEFYEWRLATGVQPATDAEVKDKIYSEFKGLDASQDGFLSAAEYCGEPRPQ